MTGSPEQDAKVADDWDVYWRGTHENAAHQEGGPQDVVLAHFWRELLRENIPETGFRRVLDLACGNGAVTGFVRDVDPQIFCCSLDYSLSAVLELRKRYPGIHCVSADVMHTPFDDETFDVVASQFGIEYAGAEAVAEVARLVAPAGLLAAVLHLHDGAIYRECAHNLHAVEAIQASELLPLARAAFSAGFDLNAGTGSGEAFKAAEKRFTPAVRELEQLLGNMGGAVASGLAQKLYRDIAHMYQRMSAYDRADIIGWVDGMTQQLVAYRGRMSSMLNAAVDAEGIRTMRETLESRGFAVLTCEQLEMGANPEAAAWVLVCQRANNA